MSEVLYVTMDPSFYSKPRAPRCCKTLISKEKGSVSLPTASEKEACNNVTISPIPPPGEIAEDIEAALRGLPYMNHSS